MISIRWRLTLSLCAAIGVLFVVTGVGVFLAMQHFLHARFDETLTAKARALITASEVDDGDFEIDLTVQDFAGFGAGGDDYFEIRRAGGGLVLRSPSMQVRGEIFDKFERYSERMGSEPVIFESQLADGRPARFYVQEVRPKDDEERRFADIYLVAASSTLGMRRELNLLATVLAVAGGAAVSLMIPMIRFGLGSGLRPLDRLSENISRMRPEELHRRVETDRLPAELKPVAVKLNEWLARLEESFERERRFSANAAHELRTPLAEIRSMAELGAKWPEEATAEHCAEIVTVCGELECLLDRLSLLARADAGRQPVQIDRVELSPLVSATIARYEEKAADRGLRFLTKIDSDHVTTDPFLWTTIFQNLIANAVSHAPAGAEVEIRVGADIIAATNPAPDLAAEDLPRLFERFWRRDESHACYEHSGLGLSIVKASAALLGAECSARLSERGDLCVEVRFQNHA
jgi:signal transduction histidine kinase